LLVLLDPLHEFLDPVRFLQQNQEGLGDDLGLPLIVLRRADQGVNLFLPQYDSEFLDFYFCL